MTNEQHLTTIAEFMGWEYREGYTYFIQITEKYKTILRVRSFDTMRMVLDKWREEVKAFQLTDEMNEVDFFIFDIEAFENKVIYSLAYGTPSDCAARLHEAIEWWKTVKN